MARKSKFEEEKNRLDSVREFLEGSKVLVAKEQDAAARTERFHDAIIQKTFKEVLIRAIELCGEEKSKEVNDGT